MPAWLWPVVSGIASVGGSLLGNQANRREAERNRQFQDRMSSSAAQRSAEDYRRAGFNPALAYDRPASTPGGSMAQQEDAISKGIGTGKEAMRLRKELAEADSRIELNRKQGHGIAASAQAAEASADKAYKEASLAQQLFDQNKILFPINQAMARTEERLQRSMLPGAQNEAKLQEFMGAGGPGLRMLAPFLRMIRPR